MRIASIVFNTYIKLLILATASLCTHAVTADQLVYVSNATSGTITRYRLDESAQILTWLGRTQAGSKVMPLATSPDKTHLYAALRAEPYRVITFAISPTGELSQAATASLPSSMTSIATDQSGRFLFAASYGGHILSVSPIDGNGIVNRSAQQVVKAVRHAHAIQSTADNRFVFSTALGDDAIMQFRFDDLTGTLTPNNPASISTPAATGPRHFVMAPEQPLLYVLGEYSGTITTYRYAVNGELQFIGVTAGFPAQALHLTNPKLETTTSKTTDPIWAADIHISPDGQFLFISERNRSIIATLKISPENGLPVYQGMVPVEAQPRGFALSGDGQFMIVAGEKSSTIGLYRIDKLSGLASKVDEAPTDDGANWVEVIPTRQ